MIKKKLIACSKKVKIDNELNLNDLKEYKTLTLFLKDKSLKSLRNSIKMFETFKKLINNLQNEILNKFSPNIIHVYDVKNVNKFWIGNSPKNFEYSKISLYESNTLSLFIFIPKNNIAITPPHSHYATDAITFTSKQAIEYELPVTINTNAKKIEILHEEASINLKDHIVIFSKKQLSENSINELVNKVIRPCLEKSSYHLIH